jgi:hypothetical protein
MGLITRLLTLPITGAPLLVERLARLVADEAERELLDDDSLRGELLSLQERLEGGELSEAEYDRQELLLLRRLDEIRAAKGAAAGLGSRT